MRLIPAMSLWGWAVAFISDWRHSSRNDEQVGLCHDDVRRIRYGNKLCGHITGIAKNGRGAITSLEIALIAKSRSRHLLAMAK